MFKPVVFSEGWFWPQETFCNVWRHAFFWYRSLERGGVGCYWHLVSKGQGLPLNILKCMGQHMTIKTYSSKNISKPRLRNSSLNAYWSDNKQIPSVTELLVTLEKQWLTVNISVPSDIFTCYGLESNADCWSWIQSEKIVLRNTSCFSGNNLVFWISLWYHNLRSFSETAKSGY